MFTFDGLKNLATAVSNKLSAWAQKAKSTVFKEKSTEKVSVTVGIPGVQRMVTGSWFSQDTYSTVLVFAVAQSQSFSTQHQKSSAGS